MENRRITAGLVRRGAEPGGEIETSNAGAVSMANARQVDTVISPFDKDHETTAIRLKRRLQLRGPSQAERRWRGSVR